MIFKVFNSLRCISHCKHSSSIRSVSTVEKLIEIDGQPINYLKTGNGSHVVLCLPGAVGTIWTDFKPQIEKLDKDKFTLFVWDPPGYGKSRPPNKIFDKNLYRTDAKFASSLMESLEINKYSMLGWSDGGITGLIVAAAFPDRVNKLAVWGANTYISRPDLKLCESIRDVSKWSKNMKDPLVQMYGEETLASMMKLWYNSMEDIFREGGDICKGDLANICSEVLVLHGDKDPIVLPEHPEFLLKSIRSSSIYRFPAGKHNIHLRYADEFNAVVEQFLETDEPKGHTGEI